MQGNQTQSRPFNSMVTTPTKVVNSGLVEYGEVVDVILNSNHSLYNAPMDIGKIFVRLVNRNYGVHSDNTISAFSMFPHQKYYPLQFEIVALIKGPTIFAGENNSECYYYFPSYNIWNIPNHNALPFIGGLYASEKDQNTLGIHGKVYDNISNSKINFGTDFNENIKVSNLQPYAGDNIYNGRWGNTLRFGSSYTSTKSPWSTGTDGNPITIIRNSTDYKNMGSLNIEDINKDDASLYLCSGQQIKIENGSNNYNAYKDKPTLPKTYVGNQVLINSDRLVFNSKKSDILFSSKKSIGFSAVDSIAVSSDKEVVLDAPKHYLGVNAKESMLLGNSTIKLLKDLILAIKLITVPTGTGPSGTPINATQFQIIEEQLEMLLSKKSYLE